MIIWFSLEGVKILFSKWRIKTDSARYIYVYKIKLCIGSSGHNCKEFNVFPVDLIFQENCHNVFGENIRSMGCDKNEINNKRVFLSFDAKDYLFK